MKVRVIFKKFASTPVYLHDLLEYKNAKKNLMKTQGAENFMATLVKISVFEKILEFEK
jgi:hypothetical protein